MHHSCHHYNTLEFAAPKALTENNIFGLIIAAFFDRKRRKLSRIRWREYFLAQAKICQVTTDSSSLVIVLYALALLLSQEQDRVEIWHQIGVKLGELVHPSNRKRARWLTSLADYCLRKGLRHADLPQNGAIRRDRAELLSKVGRFEEAQSQIRQSARILLLADDATGLALTRISRAIVYYRWSQAIADQSKRSMLLHQAQNGLKRSLVYSKRHSSTISSSRLCLGKPKYASHFSSSRESGAGWQWQVMPSLPVEGWPSSALLKSLSVPIHCGDKSVRQSITRR